MTIFEKALRKKDSKETQSSSTKAHKPEVINLVASSTVTLSTFTAQCQVLIGAVLKFFLALAFLFRLLGWQSSMAGIAATILSIMVHSFLMSKQRAVRKDLATARDKKVEAVTEALHALRQIKFSALEDQWEQHIDACRQNELQVKRRSNMISNVISVWSIISPFLVAVASMVAFATLQGEIAPSIIFPMTSVLPELQQCMTTVPRILSEYFSARLSASRIDDFLKKPEQKNILGTSLSEVVSFRDASISWPSDDSHDAEGVEKSSPSPHRFSLNNINLEFPTGQ